RSSLLPGRRYSSRSLPIVFADISVAVVLLFVKCISDSQGDLAVASTISYLWQLPDFRVGEGDIGGASTAFPEDPNFAGGEGIIADTIEVLAVDVEVQIATLSHDSDGIGLVKAILEVLSRIAEQALGLAALTIG